MARPHARLLRIGKANKVVIENWKEGVAHTTSFGKSIDQLLAIVVADRWRLAVEHRRDGNRLLRSTPCPYRSVISRYYYAMYHIARAVVFIVNEGDDFESHLELPKRIPDDFPNVADWKNKLKTARTDRNAADYDPYPTGRIHWKSKAERLKVEMDTLVVEAKKYLVNKGINVT